MRWLLLLATLLAVLPLWSAERRGLGAGFEAPGHLRASADLIERLGLALNGSFAYSEWTGALLVLATLVVVAGRVERSWGSGVLGAAFLLGGGLLNLLRLSAEAGDPSLLEVSGGWTGAALVVGLGCAARGPRWALWAFGVGFLVLVGGAAGSGAPIVVALLGLIAGYLAGRAMTPSNSAQPTARGCLLLVLVLGVAAPIELAAAARNVRLPRLFSGAPRERTPPPELGPLTAHPVPHLRLSLELPSRWRNSGRDGKRYAVFFGPDGSFVHLFRFEAHPFSRAPDTWILRNVLGTLDAPENYYSASEVRAEGALRDAALGRGYQVVIRCVYRYTDGPRSGVRCSYAFELGDDMVWLDCFVPDETGREDAEVYARSMFDSIARTVRPSAEEGPK